MSLTDAVGLIGRGNQVGPERDGLDVPEDAWMVRMAYYLMVGIGSGVLDWAYYLLGFLSFGAGRDLVIECPTKGLAGNSLSRNRRRCGYLLGFQPVALARKQFFLFLLALPKFLES